MSRDIYPVMTAASATLKHLDHIANNLANSNTIGYKERRVSFEAVLADAQRTGPLSEGYTKMSEGYVNNADGAVVLDNVPTHFALRGAGHFVVQSSQGENLLMRSGAFQLDNRGFLVNQFGDRVLTNSGPLQFDDFQRDNFTVSKDGRFLDERGAEFAQLLVQNANDLEPLDGTRWRVREGDTARNAIHQVEVIQGHLEVSNVNPFKTMVEMMETTRHFELFQKTMQSSSEMDSQANGMAKRLS